MNTIIEKKGKTDILDSCIGRWTARLAPVLKTIFHKCVISYTYSQSNSDGSILRTGSTGIIIYEVVPVYIQASQI